MDIHTSGGQPRATTQANPTTTTPAPLSMDEEIFASDMETIHIPHDSPAEIVQIGRNICTALRENTKSEKELVRAEHGRTARQNMTLMIAGAKRTLCPEFMDPESNFIEAASLAGFHGGAQLPATGYFLCASLDGPHHSETYMVDLLSDELHGYEKWEARYLIKLSKLTLCESLLQE